MTYQEGKDAIKAAIATFPATFGLRAFAGDRFRISEPNSYITEDRVMLYTDRLCDGVWRSFCKGTPSELRREIVTLIQEPVRPVLTTPYHPVDLFPYQCALGAAMIPYDVRQGNGEWLLDVPCNMWHRADLTVWHVTASRIHIADEHGITLDPEVRRPE